VYEITEMSTGRQVVTTEQAARARGITVGSMRKDINRRYERGAVTKLEPLDARTPLYYPEELGAGEPS
jgi:hypothetical protein